MRLAAGRFYRAAGDRAAARRVLEEALTDANAIGLDGLADQIRSALDSLGPANRP